ncbi:MAG: TPR end-of-group domain-containing protein, partial [Planctomycetia bacterium]
AEAGGGPERTVVVVNADSPVSLQVAHAYARRRGIPAQNLVYLEGVPTLGIVSLDTFRTRIWAPVKQQLEARGLLEEADLLAWSADFPFAVDVDAEAKAKGIQPMPHVPFRASLTGLSYFWRHVEAGETARWLDLSANRYFHPEPGARSAPAGRPPTAAEAGAMRTAQQQLQKQDWAGARDTYKALLAGAPDLVGAWYDLACCLARLGEKAAALEALAQAVQRGWANALHTVSDGDLEPLRGDPAFEALVEQMAKAQQRLAGGHASHGFAAGRLWGAGGAPMPQLVGASEAPRERYLLSVMLGYTGEWGNSAPEVLACLERGAQSDGTQPDGTVYLLANDDVRADTREPYFPFTQGLLESMGRRVAVLTKGKDGQDGVLPKGKADILGAVVGAAGFAWKGTESTLLPGALVEHLTSFGADFSHGGQTKLSELLRAGSAGSAGTVAEPLALWQKFPLPSIHVHYARGCSLAEAYYQSMAGPWQTLVVGDPLAQPFARFAAVTLPASLGAAPLAGTQALEPGLPEAVARAGGSLELWVDGRLRARGPVGTPLAFDTTAEDDGVHDLRVVHVAGDAIETRSSARARVSVANAGRSVTLQGPKEMPRLGAPLVLGGKGAGASEVDVLLGARVLATVPVKGGAFKAEVDTLLLGPATVELVARARFPEGVAARSAPLEVTPATAAPGKAAAKPAPKPRKPKEGKDKDAKAPAPAPAGAKAGLLLRVTDDKKKVHEGTLAALSDDALAKALADLKVEQATRIELAGEVQVPEDGFYQLLLVSTGRLQASWGGPRALAATASPTRMAFAGAWLKAGWNALELVLEPEGAPRLSALLGGQVVTAPLAAASLRTEAP